MNHVLAHIKPYMPVVGSALGFFLALLITVRYKIPDLARRMEAMEKSGKKKATTTEVEKAMDGFHTICRFNQASCQKENEHNWSLIRKEIDQKLAALYEKFNAMAVSNAEVVAKVELLIKDRDNH